MVSQQRLIEVFVELGDTLVDQFDITDFLHVLTCRSVELLDADAAGLMLADQSGQLHLFAASSEETRTLELFELQLNEGPCLDAFRSGTAVINVNHDTATQRWPILRRALDAGSYTSIHAVPMRLRTQVIGAMNLFLTRPGDLSPADIDLAQGLADIATIGLLQERAIRQQHDVSNQLQGALNSRIVIEQAKGIYSQKYGVSLGEAFNAMRTHARRSGRTLTNIAQEAIDGPLDDVTPPTR